jgi:hypothetical protein
VLGDDRSLQLRRPAGVDEVRVAADIEPILHNSWARSPAVVRRKVASWSHSNGIRSWIYYFGTWLPAPLTWRWLHNVHPFADGLWPSLRPISVADYANPDARFGEQ